MLPKFARVAHALRPRHAVWQPQCAASALHCFGAMHCVGAVRSVGVWHRIGASPALTWRQCVRARSAMVPPSQYDTPMSAKFKYRHVISTYWEIIPLVSVTAAAIAIVIICIIWACMYKVDVVFTTHNRNNISRTMDLCNPTPLKMMIIDQRCEPWPEMQCALDKMAAAEKSLCVRIEECSPAE